MKVKGFDFGVTGNELLFMRKFLQDWQLAGNRRLTDIYVNKELVADCGGHVDTVDEPAGEALHLLMRVQACAQRAADSVGVVLTSVELVTV